MRRVAFGLAGKFCRVLSLVLFAALGATVLMRYSPGYFTDAREMDAAYADGARTQLQTLRASQSSAGSVVQEQLRLWLHGDLGRSRHYDVPVAGLLRERSAATSRLLFRGIGAGWLLAIALALPLSARRGRRGEFILSGATAALLALPVGAFATFCVLADTGGPVLVLATLIAVRDFKLLYRILRTSWRAQHMLYARAQGLSTLRQMRIHLLPVFGRELIALAMMSVIVALSAVVPVEVVFDVPGLGQLAWAAATNRDLPVLVAVTALLAGCVGIAGLFAAPGQSTELAQCA